MIRVCPSSNHQPCARQRAEAGSVLVACRWGQGKPNSCITGLLDVDVARADIPGNLSHSAVLCGMLSVINIIPGQPGRRLHRGSYYNLVKAQSQLKSSSDSCPKCSFSWHRFAADFNGQQHATPEYCILSQVPGSECDFVKTDWYCTAQYKFIVDGDWKFAPDQQAMYDEMGNVNNVLEVQENVPENLDSLHSFEPPPSPPSRSASILWSFTGIVV